MTRTVIALVLGVLLGAGITLWLAPSSFAPRQVAAWKPPEPIALPSTDTVATPAAREASRDFYSRLAAADAATLAAMIEQAAARAPSPDRDLALAVLFKRYAELDAVRAVRLVRETRVGGAALGAVYGTWARAAPEQVLAALSTVTSPDDAADVALALIMALGDDAAAVRRVAAALAARGADTPPVGPFVAFAPPSVTGLRSALALTAQRWAELDPRRALVVARDLDDERVRLAFETAALRTLARVAPDEAFAHLASLDRSALQPAMLGALGELTRADPERLLEIARDLPPDSRRMLEATALQQLAERDPAAAARRLQGLPPGQERQMLLQVVARSYGKRDATAALAWAREQRGDPNLVGAVIGGVAENDPDRALDLALGLSAMERWRAVQMAAMTAARDDATTEAMANRLKTVEDPQIRTMAASMLVPIWSSRSPDRAMQWLIANGQDASPDSFQQIGQQLAMRDPQRAMAYTSQLPDSGREAWIRGVAQGYAQHDPHGAINWVAQFRGEEWYGRAAKTLAMAVAQRDGAAAARLVDELPADTGGVPPAQLVGMIATNWASHDPAAAAEWSLERGNEQEREMAVRSVAGVWSSQDADAARQWTLRLPQGSVRDTALAVVLTTSTMQRSSLDATVLNAFTSPRAQQAAVLQVVQQLAFRDPANARAIADTHLDATLRAQAERMIEAARNQPARIGLGTTQIVTPAQVVPPVPRGR